MNGTSVHSNPPAGAESICPPPSLASTREGGNDAESLALRAKEGCNESFEALVHLFETRIYSFLLQFTRNPSDAQDLTQITFLKAFRNIKNFQTPHAFAPWLFTIAKRSALNHFRSQRPTEEIAEDHRVQFNTPAHALEDKEEGHTLWKIAERLPPPQREAIWLRYAEGFSIEETATIMRTNQLRVRVLLHRGRGRLATLLRGMGKDQKF
jgi:RNA polymerase sigma-70 factor (ECF subfamily)